MKRNRAVHFHHSDGRFCGSTEQGRRFATEFDDVTCRRCKYGSRNDRLVLTEQGSAYVCDNADHYHPGECSDYCRMCFPKQPGDSELREALTAED